MEYSFASGLISAGALSCRTQLNSMRGISQFLRLASTMLAATVRRRSPADCCRQARYRSLIFGRPFSDVVVVRRAETQAFSEERTGIHSKISRPAAFYTAMAILKRRLHIPANCPHFARDVTLVAGDQSHGRSFV